MNAIVHSLTRIRWELFASLTFQGKPPKSHRATGLVFDLLNYTAHVSNVPSQKLLWVIRQELGELGGRNHFHLLIGDSGSKNLLTLSYQVERLWNRITGGFAKVRVYDRRLSGVDYICKCLEMNTYEVNKFNDAEFVILSVSARKVILSQMVPEAGAAIKQKSVNKRAADSGSGTSPVEEHPSALVSNLHAWDGSPVVNIGLIGKRLESGENSVPYNVRKCESGA